MKEQRQRILKLVEEGKLSAEEALTLIEALESDEKAKNEKYQEISSKVYGDKEYEEKAKQFQEKQSSIGTKLMDWVDTAVKKVKEMDLDLNFGKSIDIQHIYQLQEANFTDIDINIPNGSVNLQPWSEQDVRIECDAKLYRAENTEQAKNQFIHEVECLIEGNRLILHTDKKTMKINVRLFVPEQKYEQIKIKLFNGPIRGEDLQVENVKAKTANGVVSFSAVTAKNGEFETASGQIKLTNSHYETIEAESITGLIQFNGTATKLDAQSFNGNLQLTVTDSESETIYAKTTTGNIDISVPEQTKVVGELKSNLGTLAVELKNADITYEKSDTIQKEVKFRTAEDTNLTLFADTKVGSVTIQNT
ncbi:DUF4097 family beta strand repeat-containing protein [Metabacillus malikii]|uniref:DUF4097 and DUF4098 domain-containing protein YvlB n=1 Tax=Metabacillus malikii TaxID=1504265 RepID=A0ABT9ZMH4_9BACI|nr:DUF4097 domain-containing protein [Metabacillus malikii]MDQ0233483.1 DUF4097 and DUF4098 domain-containing protein YvlB [Metabacillus malikii]